MREHGWRSAEQTLAEQASEDVKQKRKTGRPRLGPATIYANGQVRIPLDALIGAGVPERGPVSLTVDSLARTLLIRSDRNSLVPVCRLGRLSVRISAMRALRLIGVHVKKARSADIIVTDGTVAVRVA